MEELLFEQEVAINGVKKALQSFHKQLCGGKHYLFSCEQFKAIPMSGRKESLSELIAKQAHLKSLHGGSRLTVYLIRQNFWT